MKGEKYNKTAQESSSIVMRSNTDHITELLGTAMCMGNFECTPEDDATRVEYQMLYVRTACIKGNITR